MKQSSCEACGKLLVRNHKNCLKVVILKAMEEEIMPMEIETYVNYKEISCNSEIIDLCENPIVIKGKPYQTD